MYNIIIFNIICRSNVAPVKNIGFIIIHISNVVLVRVVISFCKTKDFMQCFLDLILEERSIYSYKSDNQSKDKKLVLRTFIPILLISYHLQKQIILLTMRNIWSDWRLIYLIIATMITFI